MMICPWVVGTQWYLQIMYHRNEHLKLALKRQITTERKRDPAGLALDPRFGPVSTHLGCRLDSWPWAGRVCKVMN